MTWEKKVGVCVKDAEKRVLSQNSICEKLCGVRTGDICLDACMGAYKDFDEKFINEGFHKFECLKVKNGEVDAVVVNDGESLVTLLYPLEAKFEKQIEMLKEHGLTKSELNVMRFVIQGLTNGQIAKKLFISKPSLRTHLNNIYKKLPKTLRSSVMTLRREK